MKYSLVFLVLALSACGKNSDSPAGASCGDITAVGTWHHTSIADTLVFNDQCGGTSSFCHEEFTYSHIKSGETGIVNITKTDGGANCLALGAHSCVAIWSDHDLAFNCGGGLATYKR